MIEKNPNQNDFFKIFARISEFLELRDREIERKNTIHYSRSCVTIPAHVRSARRLSLLTLIKHLIDWETIQKPNCPVGILFQGFWDMGHMGNLR